MTVANIKGVQSHGYFGARPRPPEVEIQKAIADAQKEPVGVQKAFADAKVGQEVSLQIVGKITEGRYLAASGESRYTVQSSMEFVVGQTVKATVSALGGIVELKYIGSGQFELASLDAAAEQTTEDNVETPLVTLQSKFKIALPANDKAMVESLSENVLRPDAMVMGALFLNKLSTPIDNQSLKALYAKQLWSDAAEPSSALAASISALIAGVQQANVGDADRLANILGDAVEQNNLLSAQSNLSQAVLSSASGLNFDDHGGTGTDNDSLKELAHRLLNTQDSGTLAYHYGSLPILIANQLVELDLVLFRERQTPLRTQGLRKLVMTLKTASLGRVEIVAQSLENTLSVSIGTQSPAATELLAKHAQEVRELAVRLGWNVDSVSYRLVSDPVRAGEQLVRHVLNSGTLDAVV